MGKITFGILLVLLIGCKNFQTKKLSSEEVLTEQLKHFNWNEVDIYPSFDSCQELLDKPALKKCFETVLTQHIYNEFSQHQIVSGDTIKEIVMLYLVISAEGSAEIDSVAISQELHEQIPDLKNWLASGIDKLPKIYPARTRGIPVATKFTLPIRVVSE